MADILNDMNNCPRCGHKIPNDLMPGAYIGALSRADNQTYVCSACGLHEALLQMSGEDIDIANWPVAVPENLYEMNRPEKA